MGRGPVDLYMAIENKQIYVSVGLGFSLVEETRFQSWKSPTLELVAGSIAGSCACLLLNLSTTGSMVVGSLVHTVLQMHKLLTSGIFEFVFFVFVKC